MSLPEWLLWLSLLLASAVALGVLAQRVHLQLSVVLAVIGVLAAALGGAVGLASPLRGHAFEEAVVFLFLPLLVFEAALRLSVRDFVRNLVPILVLAVVAMVLSAALVGVALHRGLAIPLTAALLFGALISATDPVAVVAVFRELGVPRRLLTLVEGESLLNDAGAIVLFTILLGAALGGTVSVADGILDFVTVFVGGATLGVLIGLAAALVLPWLDRLLAATLSVAVAYGSFVLADEVLGVSGVMATVAAGLTLSWLAPSHATAPVRELWHALWDALGYIANALLFLLIGLAINPRHFGEHLGAIALAILVVLLARAAAVLPLVALLERIVRIPPVGLRNQAVLIWGGLRGGVALALALALPEQLAERELFIALTGGVVLATLLLNATTIGMLVHRLGLDAPSRADRFLAGSARLSGLVAARARLAELGLEDPIVTAELDAADQAAQAELAQTRLTDAEERDVVARRGLWVERETYQHLRDAGLLPPAAARLLLHEVDDQIEEVRLGRPSLAAMRRGGQPVVDRLLERLSGWLPRPLGDDPTELAYAEALARRLAARRAGEALELFARLPNITPASIEGARALFARWEQEAVASLDRLLPEADLDRGELQRRQAASLSRMAATDRLAELAAIGLLPTVVVHRATEAVAAEVADRPATAPDGADGRTRQR